MLLRSQQAIFASFAEGTAGDNEGTKETGENEEESTETGEARAGQEN